MSMMRMSVSDWIKVRDNPIQRDTERHAQQAKHLLTPLPIHAIVFAAKLPNGDLVKLDGHTRALLWKRNQVKHPPHVDVNVIQVDSVQEAQDLYKTLDSKDAVETASDKVTGGLSLIKLEPQSSLVATGNLTTALRLAWRGLTGISQFDSKHDIYEIVQEFTPELTMLDAFGLKVGDVKASMIGAFLLTYRKHGDKILPFWRAFFGNAGIKRDGKMDAVQALTECCLSRKKNYGGSASIDLCSRSLRAAEKWLADEWLTNYPNPMEVSNYAAPKKAVFSLVKKGARAGT
jgi:hypothetical protein